MAVQNSDNVNSDWNDWNPMQEAFTSGKKYEQGPGAGLHYRRKQIGKENKIILKNLPHGIMENGIRNLCLSAGIPTSVNIVQNINIAFVTFKTFKEAELAVQDLNNTPPYFMKVGFAREQGEDKSARKNCEIEKLECGEKWNSDSFDTFCSTKHHYLRNKLAEKKLNQVQPYFSILSEYDDPSLIMRQRKLDITMEKECVSKGRGYINIKDINRHKCENRIFSCKSDDWNDNDCEIADCLNCGSATYKKHEGVDGNYCSNQCKINVELESVANSNSTIFDLFTPGVCGSLDFLNEDQDGLMKCRVMLDKEYEKYERLMNCDMKEGQVVSAEKGERVLVRSQKGRFFRGVVYKNEGNLYRVALIDSCEEILVREVYSLPEDLGKMPSLGGVATLCSDCFPDSGSIKFRAKERKVFDSWICEIIDDNNAAVCEMTLEKWSVPEELTFVQLQSGCPVVITAFKDMNTVFVRRTDSPWDQDFIRLSNDVAEYSLEAKKFKKMPELGEVCSVLYKNECFYRAVVTCLRKNSVSVEFMDYGNEEETELGDLRHLPNMVRNVNCFAVRVRLKNVPKKSSPESVYYFNRLTAYGNVLHLTLVGEEVILTDEASGDVINDVVADMMIPVWEKDSSVFMKSGEIYFLDSVEELKFRPGDIEDIFLLNVDIDEFNNSGAFSATRNRSDYLGHLNGELKQMMTEYYQCLSDDPYRPRIMELCLVESGGDIYRGVSLDDITSPYKVFLIDFGKLESFETKNMRKILKEFLEMPALAVKCRVSDFDKFDEKKQREVREYMMKMDKKCLKNVKIMQERGGVYEISIPFVQELLG